MEKVSIKISTTMKDGKKCEPIIISVERGETIEELKAQGYSEADIVSHVVRDENSNVGNAARAALAAAVEEGQTDPDALTKVVNEAATRYESGERAVRSKGGAAALKGKVVAWALSTEENQAEFTKLVAEFGPVKAMEALTEAYKAAHPAKA